MNPDPNEPSLTRQRLSLLTLLAANLVPLLAVIGFGWDLASVIIVFWLENAIIGLFTIGKMMLASGGVDSTSANAGAMVAEKVALSVFFTLHYGGFWAIHGMFVLAIFGVAGSDGRTIPGVLHGALHDVAMQIALAVLFISHGVSFVVHYVYGGEYRQMTLKRAMTLPYSRVVVLHLTILFGGFVAMALGAPLVAVVLLVLIKMFLDAAAHLREHRAASPASATTSASAA